jgi:hypothetical protein
MPWPVDDPENLSGSKVKKFSDSVHSVGDQSHGDVEVRYRSCSWQKVLPYSLEVAVVY